MDSDDEQEYFAMDSGDEMNSDDEMDSSVSIPKIPSFETMTADEIVKLMNQYIEEVESIVEMPATTTATRILLSHTKWDKQELLDRLTDENRDEFFKVAHVQNPFKVQPKKRPTRKQLTCSICFSDFSQLDIVGLGCDHEYCKDCWRQYLTIKISDDGHAESICCPATKCGIAVDDVTVMQLVSDENTRQKYQHLMTNSFVEHNHSLRWCPSPGCSLAVKANHLIAYRQNCKCQCGQNFCFNCGDDSHDPIPCNLMKNWKKNDNDKTIEYLTKYTKCCPKCHSIIEKNGGCNHMTCRKCNHEFCWLCFGNWKGHGGGCNTYKSADDVVDDQKRWEHYFKRYGLHKKSLKIELGLVESVNSKMDELQAMGKSWNEVQFLMKAVEILWESRRQLMFTYIFAYFVKTHHQKTIFEVNQCDLEKATENLSQYFEQDLTKDNAEEIKNNVLNRSNYCERRQKTMQEHIFEGFENNWWAFQSFI
ncbi:E3 ubiquitin-protein ligase ariadne-1-like [Sitodiplosis mosellana]|uniref:E3 ubiquitin-protein ligase ariadne-1-like n=1 Tax=Sitodiplosis mosellana TaxID=263140 RepID=UPI00244410C2|nr:E3 ubiquitin-protein ligase ariadne-1-like [Sitodiplosis mosellana]